MKDPLGNPLLMALADRKAGLALSFDQRDIIAKAEKNKAKGIIKRRKETEELRRPLLAAVVKLEILEGWSLAVICEKIVKDFPSINPSKLSQIKSHYKNIYLEELKSLQKSIKQSQMSALIRAQDKLNRLMPEAVQTLGDVMKDAGTAAGVKVKAAEAILKRSGFDEQAGAGFSVDPKEAASYSEFIEADEVEILDD